MPSTTVTDLPADVSNYGEDENNTTHITTFPLVLTTDPDAPANSIEFIGIDVFEMVSNAYITTFEVPVRVGENVNAILTPTSQTVNLSIGESITTSVVIKNEGNTPATFGVYLDTGSAGEIDFVLETPTVVQIGAGAGPNLNHRWRLKNKVNFSSAARIEVDSKGCWCVSFIFDDDAGRDRFTNGKVDRLAGRS